MSRRIVFNTFGSLGDLHPHLAIGLGMQARGHAVAIATSEYYRSKIEAAGLEFLPVRPDLPDQKFSQFAVDVMDNWRGPETIVKKLLMPQLRDTYQDLLRAVEGADLLVSHVIPYAAPLVAERTGIPWASIGVAPLCFFSSFDPPVLPQVPWLDRLRFLGRGFFGPLLWLGKRSTHSWTAQWRKLRAELGLPRYRGNPLTDAVHAPRLVVCIFSPLFAQIQPDWPRGAKITGFPFYDQHAGVSRMPEELERFLAAGPPPLVFTLGSAAVWDARNFFEVSAEAARRLGMRAILLVGKETGNTPASLPEHVIACEYAPFGELFPRAAAVVHQGGVGTTGQGLRSGRPTLIMPFSHDQFDNAARVRRLGCSRTIQRHRYTAESATRELRLLLDDRRTAAKAEEVGRQISAERGVESACNALEELLRAPREVASARG